jgi:hypothetical protein
VERHLPEHPKKRVDPAHPDLGRAFSRVKRSWHVLSRQSTLKSIDEALDKAFAGAGVESKVTQDRLRRAVSRNFIQAALRRARTVQGATRKSLLHELESSKNSVLQSRNAAREELDELRDKAARLRAALDGDEDLSRSEDERALDRELEEKVSSLHLHNTPQGPNLSLDPDSVAELTAFVRTQRRRALSLGMSHERKAIAILERRITKLNTTLGRSEEALRILAGKSHDHAAVTSLFRDLQGLVLDSPNGKAKVAALRVLFEENLEMQRNAAG